MFDFDLSLRVERNVLYFQKLKYISVICWYLQNKNKATPTN